MKPLFRTISWERATWIGVRLPLDVRLNRFTRRRRVWTWTDVGVRKKLRRVCVVATEIIRRLFELKRVTRWQSSWQLPLTN